VEHVPESQSAPMFRSTNCPHVEFLYFILACQHAEYSQVARGASPLRNLASTSGSGVGTQGSRRAPDRTTNDLVENTHAEMRTQSESHPNVNADRYMQSTINGSINMQQHVQINR